jgi:hypothetical protein
MNQNFDKISNFNKLLCLQNKVALISFQKHMKELIISIDNERVIKEKVPLS